MSADPLAIHGLGGDLNPYAYVRGRVMSHVDPLGLSDTAVELAGAGPPPGKTDNGSSYYEPPGGWGNGAAESAAFAGSFDGYGVSGPSTAGANGLQALDRDGVPQARSGRSNLLGVPMDGQSTDRVIRSDADWTDPGMNRAHEQAAALTVAVLVTIAAGPASAAIEDAAWSWFGRLLARRAVAGAAVTGGGAAAALCFAEGTLVETCASGAQPIETIREGDEVLSENEASGMIECARVSRTFERFASDVAEISFATEAAPDETFAATLDHPFWIEGRGWTAVRDLKPGDVGSSPMHRQVTVTRGPAAVSGRQVYNLEVTGTHTYFVGATQILAHNTCTAAERAIQVVGRLPARLFQRLNCTNCAGEIVKALETEKIQGQVLEMQTVGKHMSHDLLPGGTALTSNGFHTAIRVGDMVFDNFFQQGVPYGEYIGGLRAVGTISISSRPF